MGGVIEAAGDTFGHVWDNRGRVQRHAYPPTASMARPWQFSLKSLLAVIAVLSVPFWMVTNSDESVRFWGKVLLGPILCGCAGYLAAGWGGIWPGIAIGAILTAVILLFVLPLL